MLRDLARLAACAALAAAGAAGAQTIRNESAPTPQPVLTVTTSATASVPNDRMHAWLRAEAENADAAAAAGEVNARIARALQRAKGTRGVDVATSGYSTYPIAEKDRPPRWRVAQGMSLESSDFVALVGLLTKLQSEDRLLLSGINFSVSPAAQRAAEDGLIDQAIKAWHQRAELAAKGFGGGTWRPGRVTIQGADFGRPQPLMRMQAMSAAQPAPVTVEAGSADVTVSVSGEAILETVRPPTR